MAHSKDEPRLPDPVRLPLWVSDIEQSGRETRLKLLLDDTEVGTSVLFDGNSAQMAKFDPAQRAALDALKREVRLKAVLLTELNDVLKGLSPVGSRKEEKTESGSRLEVVRRELEAEMLDRDQLLFLLQRCQTAKQRVKGKAQGTKTALAELQTRASALAEEVTAVELDAHCFLAQTHKLQVSTQQISQAVDSRRLQAHSKVLTQHSDTTLSIQQSTHQTARRKKLKLHLQRLQQRLNVQKSTRIRILMCEGVLQMAYLKLKGRFEHLADTFESQDVQEIIEKCEGARITTVRYATEVEDRLSQISRLLKTLKELQNQADLLYFSTDSKKLYSEKPKFREIAQSRIANIAICISTLSGILNKFKSADPRSRLCVYFPLPERIDSPSTVAALLLQLEKTLLAARDGGKLQKTVKSSTMGQMVLTMKVMLGGMLLKSNRGSIRKRTLKSLYSPQPLTGAESPVLSTIRTRLQADQADLQLPCYNEEHSTAITERKAYHQFHLFHTPTPQPQLPASPRISQTAHIKELDKLRGELVRARKKPLVRAVASEELLSLRKSVRRLVQPLRIPVTARTEVEIPLSEAIKKWSRRTLSPSSTTSTKGSHMPSPRGNYSSRLRRLAGL